MMIDNQTMIFPKTFKEFADMFSIKDIDEVYSNGIDFIPVFRVEQWLEHTSKKGDKYCPNCGAKMIEPQESEE